MIKIEPWKLTVWEGNGERKNMWKKEAAREGKSRRDVLGRDAVLGVSSAFAAGSGIVRPEGDIIGSGGRGLNSIYRENRLGLGEDLHAEISGG